MRRDLEQIHYLVVPAAWLSILGSPLFWALWTWGVSGVQDSLFLRLTTVLVCLPGVFYPRLPALLLRHFHLYWHAAILHGVPFTFTYLLLLNQFNTIWLLCHLGGFILLMELVPSASMYALVAAVGTAGALLMYLLIDGQPAWALLPLWYLAVLAYGLAFTFIILHATMRKHLATEAAPEALLALSGTIAHELRKPLAIGQQTLTLVEDELQVIANDPAQADAARARLLRAVATGQRALARGDMLMGIILHNMRDDGVDRHDFGPLSLAAAVEHAVDSYAYARGQRERVRLEVHDSGMVYGNENLIIHVVYNLLQNALRFDKTHSALTVTLVVLRVGRWMILRVHDTGPGFDEDRLLRVHALLRGKSAAIRGGLGLAFCRRAVDAMGGRIKIENHPLGGAQIVVSLQCR